MVTIGGVQYPLSDSSVNLSTLNAAHQGKEGAGIYQGIIIDTAKNVQANFEVHIYNKIVSYQNTRVNNL